MIFSPLGLAHSIVLPRAADSVRRKNSKQLDDREFYLNVIQLYEIYVRVGWRLMNDEEILHVHNGICMRTIKLKSVR